MSYIVLHDSQPSKEPLKPTAVDMLGVDGAEEGAKEEGEEEEAKMWDGKQPKERRTSSLGGRHAHAHT